MRELSKREKIYIGIFALTLVWGVWNYKDMILGGSKKNAPQPIAAVQPAARLQAAGLVTAQPAVVSATIAHDLPAMPDWKNDPFQRTWRYPTAPAVRNSTSKRRSAPPLKLTAVVVRPGSKYAVINGSIIREGGRVAGRTVKRIEESKVIVDDEGVEVTLNL